MLKGPWQPFPVASPIVEKRQEHNAQEIHRKKLQEAKAVIDQSEPRAMPSSRDTKKAEREAERQAEIEAENERMYQRLSAIDALDSTKIIKGTENRSSLNIKQGMFYSTVGGSRLQCIDHINHNAMSNPASVHYRPASQAGRLLEGSLRAQASSYSFTAGLPGGGSSPLPPRGRSQLLSSQSGLEGHQSPGQVGRASAYHRAQSSSLDHGTPRALSPAPPSRSASPDPSETPTRSSVCSQSLLRRGQSQASLCATPSRRQSLLDSGLLDAISAAKAGVEGRTPRSRRSTAQGVAYLEAAAEVAEALSLTSKPSLSFGAQQQPWSGQLVRRPLSQMGSRKSSCAGGLHVLDAASDAPGSRDGGPDDRRASPSLPAVQAARSSGPGSGPVRRMVSSSLALSSLVSREDSMAFAEGGAGASEFGTPTKRDQLKTAYLSKGRVMSSGGSCSNLAGMTHASQS